MSGSASAGGAAETAPRTLTPRLSSPSSSYRRARQREADQRTGNSRVDPLGHGDDRQNAETDHERQRVGCVQMRGEDRQFAAAWRRRARQPRGCRAIGKSGCARKCRPESPSSRVSRADPRSSRGGKCRRRKAETRPSAPASRASTRYSGEPETARAARPPAKIGVMVESAPHDRKRLLPNTANASEPARKAKKPICGANPPSRAVAICSGIAIAASVNPANRSWVRN